MQKLILVLTLFILCLSNANAQSHSKVYISYPRGKEDKTLNIFFNTTNVGKIRYGERLVFSFNAEGVLKITISENKEYVEPRTLSKNTRSVDLKNEKSYYLELRKGELIYVADQKKGEAYFNDSSNFTSPPVEPEIKDIESLLQ